MMGISQPQIHNVLKGARKLRPEIADRLIAALKMALLDLLETAELREHLGARPANEDGFLYPLLGAESQFTIKRARPTSIEKKLPTRETARITRRQERAI